MAESLNLAVNIYQVFKEAYNLVCVIREVVASAKHHVEQRQQQVDRLDEEILAMECLGRLLFSEDARTLKICITDDNGLNKRWADVVLRRVKRMRDHLREYKTLTEHQEKTSAATSTNPNQELELVREDFDISFFGASPPAPGLDNSTTNHSHPWYTRLRPDQLLVKGRDARDGLQWALFDKPKLVRIIDDFARECRRLHELVYPIWAGHQARRNEAKSKANGEQLAIMARQQADAMVRPRITVVESLGVRSAIRAKIEDLF